MENLIIQILNTLIQNMFASYYFISLSDCKKNSKLKFIFVLIFTLIITNITDIINIKQYSTLLNTIILSTSFILLIKFVIKTSLLKSILIVISYYILVSIAELISFYTLNSLLNLSLESILNVPTNFILLIILQHIIALILVIIFNIFITKKYKITKLNLKNLKLLLFMIIGYIIPQIIVFSIANYTFPLSIMIINVSQIILVSILIFSYFKRTVKEEQIELELATAEMHNKTLIEIVDSVRTLKHDYGNIVQALNGYVITKQYEQLDEYVNSLLKEFNSVNNVSSIDPKIFNEPAIYGVVGAKYFFATENDITFELEVTSDIKNINFSKPELSRIFGILLDNAIEATQKAKEKYIKLEINFNEKKYADVIRVINSYDTSIKIDLENIYEKGVSSKKVKSGIGLWEVKKLVKKNNHSQIYATIENNKFIQNLIIEKID